MATLDTPPLPTHDLIALKQLPKEALYRLLVAQLAKQKLGLNWESNDLERDAALNANVVLPRLVPEISCTPAAWAATANAQPQTQPQYQNLVIEGDNYDSLRLLRSTHGGKVRVIYIDPPYNTGNKDWVYNDRYVGANDKYRHSQWLEFLYRRLTLARDLLAPDGVIMVSINDENRSRLELLMDEVFPGMKLGSFVWKTRSGSNDEQALFSVDHEHILVYGHESFKFNGEDKDFAQYKNPDKDPRGRWKTGDLGQGKTYLERPNAYYPIQNPKTGVWYPCNPAVVWRFASEARIEDVSQLRAKSMEQYIREDKVLFPNEKTERVETWATKEALLAAIASGDVPVRPKTKTPLITADLPDLDFWVGRPVGFGRPWFKRHLSDVQSDLRPITSWIRGATEVTEMEEDWAQSLMAQRSGTGELSVNEILGKNAFPYPKPLSLIKGLLAQATRPNDLILDFFAGSGTTGQAVLELNAEDGGQRRFILCSSTEATDKEPQKNICRDVCAERMRRVIQGVNGGAGFTAAQGGAFAYLQLDLIEAADVLFEAQPAQAAALLALRRFGVVQGLPADFASGEEAILRLGRVDDCDILLCSAVNMAVVERLAHWPAPRIAVYSKRHAALQRLLQARGVSVNAYGLIDALKLGQAQKLLKRRAKAMLSTA